MSHLGKHNKVVFVLLVGFFFVFFFFVFFFFSILFVYVKLFIKMHLSGFFILQN